MRRARSPGWVWGPLAIWLALLGAVWASGSNQPLFVWLNHAGQGAAVWAYLSLFGDGAVALALVAPCIRRWPQCFWAALLAALLCALYVQAIKQLIDLPRPAAVLAPGSFFQYGPAFRAVSFPSGHAAAASALAGIVVIGATARTALRLGAVALAMLVGMARIMVGVHWPLDVLGGLAGGWMAAWMALAWQGHRRWRTASAAGVGAGLVLLVIAGALLFSRHVGMASVLPLQRTLGLICLGWGAWEMLRMLPRGLGRRAQKGNSRG